MNLLRILDSTPEPPIVDLQIEPTNDSGEYHLATPIYEFQRELTDQIVSLHYSDILKYCETNDQTELIVKSLQICIHNCMLVSSHPYLLITHYMPKNLLQRDMALKLAETSGKFNVLKDLIKVINETIINGSGGNISSGSKKRGPNSDPDPGNKRKQQPDPKDIRNVGIIFSDSNAKIIDLLEALLIGNINTPFKLKRYTGNYLRRDHKKNEPVNARLTIHLIFEKEINNNELINQLGFDLIIKTDERVSNDTIDLIRSQNRDTKANLIKLIPMLSIEHCKLFFEPTQHDDNYLYKLISSIVCLREQIGILPPDIFPIYNQGLHFLDNFFEQVFFKKDVTNPVWPLPESPSIPDFSAIDVEKSLLTEVYYHYTPYDGGDSNNSNENDDGGNGNSTSIGGGANGGNSGSNGNSGPGRKPKVRDPIKPKKTYYELNRLQLNYITNPLTNNFDKLIGIFNHDASKLNQPNLNYLTHRLITQINDIYLQYNIINEEYHCYREYNQPEVQERIGRRERELNQALTNLLGDIDHSNSRIELGNKKIFKKMEDIETMTQEVNNLKSSVNEFKPKTDTDNTEEEKEKRLKLIKNQLRVWELGKSIETSISKIKSKQEEKNYMKQEYENSLDSIKASKSTISELRELNKNLHKRFDNLKSIDIQEMKTFQRERNVLLNKISEQKELNKNLNIKLTKSLRYLRDSSHLKKRKGRGITPK